MFDKISYEEGIKQASEQDTAEVNMNVHFDTSQIQAGKFRTFTRAMQPCHEAL